MRYAPSNTMAVLVLLLAGCAEDPPPPTVADYLENRILLDAAMSRCGQQRAELKYEQECINAREASNRIAREEEAERYRLLEAQSERKRTALRRAQEAADEARRRAAEAEARRREAEYLSLFEPAVGETGGVAPEVDGEANTAGGAYPGMTDEATSASSGGTDAELVAPQTDLDAIREELQRRNDQS